ncbi:MAG: hypothetical protein M0R80_08555 [Proteobacteria bacterium]|jgi:hypothetical protein|nr:hypothetical protein [Pseudomonadota bacterium]
MDYWFEEREEPYCFIKPSQLANWRWEEVECDEEEDELDEDFINWFED